MNASKQQESEQPKLYLVIASEDGVSSSIWPKHQLHQGVLYEIYYTPSECPQEEADYWAAQLRDDDNWTDDRSHFHQSVGEIGNLDIYLITDTAFIDNQRKQLLSVIDVTASTAERLANTPATPSADEEIERIADLLHADVSKVFHRSLAADSRPVIRERLEELAALLSASHTNEREEWIKRSEEWRINAEEKRNHLKTAEATLVAREGEIERLKEKVANQAKVWSTELSALQAELETSNKTIQALQEELEYCPACATAKAELATAQLRVAGLEAALKQKDNIQDRSDADAAEIGRLESQHERKDKYVLELEAKLQGAMALNSENEKLSGQVSDLADERDKYANTILSLRSQLTEAQAKLKESEEGYLIVAKADELIKQTLTAQLTEANAKLAEAERDTKRLDWLEANPDKIKDSTWLNHNLGWLISFTHDETLGECKQTLRQAVDKALTRIGQ